MLRYLLLIAFLGGLFVNAQESKRYSDSYALYKDAYELYEKEKYASSRVLFDRYLKENPYPLNQFLEKATFYRASCAYQLYNKDARFLLDRFVDEFPGSNYIPQVRFMLGNLYFSDKDYEGALENLNNLRTDELDSIERAEYTYKKAYCYFMIDDSLTAKLLFYDLLDSKSKYSIPATYYYGHINFMQKNYQTALEAFLTIKDQKLFKKVIPVYLIQIYHYQGRYQELVEYSAVMDTIKVKEEAKISQLVGNAYYRLHRFEEAIPYLEQFQKAKKSRREDYFELAYCYFQTKAYNKAIPYYQQVVGEIDSLDQIALYHLAISYDQIEKPGMAQLAFQKAYGFHFDEQIREDALYRWAILAYKMDLNPYNQAVVALQKYLKEYPKSSKTDILYDYLINIYTTTKNYQTGLQEIAKVDRKTPKMKEAYQFMAYNYAVELFSDGKYDAARDAFRLVQTYPINQKLTTKSLYWIAEAFYKQEEYEKAIQAYRYFQKQPGAFQSNYYPKSNYNIAYAYFKQKNYHKALESFRSFLEDEERVTENYKEDVYLRLGDCYYVLAGLEPDTYKTKDKEAIKYYSLAANMKGNRTDYANYQLGLSYGYLGENEKKIDALNNIAKKERKTGFAAKALFEIAQTYQNMREWAKAETYYNKILIDYPKNPLKKESELAIATLLFYQKDYDASIDALMNIYTNNKGNIYEQKAIAGLKDAYKAKDELPAYYDWLEQESIQVPDANKEEELFAQGEKYMLEENYTSAARIYSQYVDQVPQGGRILEVHYRRMASYVKLSDTLKAITDMEWIADQPVNKYTTEVVGYLGNYYFKVDSLLKAIRYLKEFMEVSNNDEKKYYAEIKLMKSYYFQKMTSEMVLTAEKVLANPETKGDLKVEAHFIMGKGLFELESYEDALVHLAYVYENNSGILSAEAQFLRAKIYHIMADYNTSEQMIKKLVKNRQGYADWIAKALILETYNLIEKDDLFQAEATILSIINNYKGGAEIELEAKEAWELVQKLKEEAKQKEEQEQDQQTEEDNKNEEDEDTEEIDD